MNTTAKIALAASGGYILGRTKKMKLAAMLALFLAGQKLPKSPLELVQQGAGALSKNEKFAELSQQVTGSLLDAGKVAASRSAERWLTGVGDKLREGIPTPGSGDSESADEPEDSEDTDAEDTDAEDTDAEDTEAEDSEDTEAEDSDADDEDTDTDSDEGEQEDSSADSRPKKAAGSRTRSSSRSSGSGTRQSKSGSRSRSAKGA